MNKTLIQKFAERFSVDADNLFEILKATAFRQKSDSKPISDEQMMALLIVAEQYGLNPFTKEIYAYPDKQNGIVPVVGVDGWSRINNQHPTTTAWNSGPLTTSSKCPVRSHARSGWSA
jgi:hypothetical protein